jgi:hypothetical protein
VSNAQRLTPSQLKLDTKPLLKLVFGQFFGDLSGLVEMVRACFVRARWVLTVAISADDERVPEPGGRCAVKSDALVHWRSEHALGQGHALLRR